MKNGALYIGFLLPFVCLAVLPSYGAEVSQQELQTVEQQAQKRQMEHKKLQAQAVQLSLELAKMNKKMISAAKQLQADEEKTTRSEQELELLENKLKRTEEDFNKEHAKLAVTLASLQNLALHPTEAVLVQPLSPVEVMRSAVLLRESVPYLNEKAAKIKKALEEISQQKKQVEDKLAKLENQKKSILKQQQNLKKLSSQKAQMRRQIEGQSHKTAQEAALLAEKASDLRDLMDKLEHDKELRRRREEEIKRAAREREIAAQRRLEEEQRQRMQSGQSSGLSTENGATYDHVPSDDGNVSLVKVKPQRITGSAGNFADARGALTRPARGEIITSYGQELSKGVTSKGIVIKTRPAAQIIAPYDGSVIFSGPFKGYGNLVIVDHGRGYVSLLAGMGSVETETGQMVLAGEPVGIMPDLPAAKLYMEIRKNQHPVNPAPWLEK